MNRVLICVCAALVLVASALSHATAYPSQKLETSAKTSGMENGERLSQFCRQCHGLAGGGDPHSGVPAIAGQHFSVVVKELMDYRYFRRWDPSMERLNADHHLRMPADISDVAAYVSRLPRPAAAEPGTGEFVRLGAALYMGRCAICHGRDARGNELAAVPNLAAQHYHYLLRQFHDAVEGRRPNFTAAHIRLLEPLQRDELEGLADFLSRQPP